MRGSKTYLAKTGLVCLALVAAFAILPVSYAHITGEGGNWPLLQQIPPNTPEYAAAFTSVQAYDNEGSLPKDVAETTASITDSRNITVAITNAYPGYKGSVDFTVTNTGTAAIELTGTTITNPNPGALDVSVNVALGELQPGASRSGLLELVITNNATPSTPYGFSVGINFSDLNS